MEQRLRGATRQRTQSPVPGPARDVTPPSARRASGSRGSGMVALAASVKGKEVVRNPLAGFDDREEEVDPREELGMPPIEDVDEEEHCAICLSPIADRAVISPCHHGQFCFGCISPWTTQSRRCPLCLGNIHHLIHNIRGDKDFQIHHLHPLSTTIDKISSGTSSSTVSRHSLYGRRRTAADETTWRERAAELAIERRAYIYRESLFAKHIASNRYTGFKPFTPTSFGSNAELKARVIRFVRRELQVFPNVDIAFLATYVITIASQLDLRSASAIRLLSDFLGDDAEQFAHEVCTFARSPFTTLEGFDRCVQYGRPDRVVPAAPMTNAVKPAILPSALPQGPPGPTRGIGGGDRGRGNGRREPFQDSRRRDVRRYFGKTYRDGSRSRSRERSRDRSRERNRSRDRSRSRSRNRRRSDHRRDAGSRSRSRDRSRSRSRRRHSPSRSRSPHHRSPSPSNLRSSRRISATPPPHRSPSPIYHPRTPEPPAAVTLSIFGVAKRNQPLDDTVDHRSIAATAAEVRRAHEPKSALDSDVPLLDRSPSPAALELREEPLVPVVAPSSDLRSRLQARLTAEYRTALATSRAPAAPALRLVESDLRAVLQNRLRVENAAMDRDDYDEYDGGPEDSYVTTFSAETRALLLDRLEEEKRLSAGSSSIASRTAPNVVDKEAALRASLALRRKSKVVVDAKNGTVDVVKLKSEESLKDKLRRRLAEAKAQVTVS